MDNEHCNVVKSSLRRACISVDATWSFFAPGSSRAIRAPHNLNLSASCVKRGFTVVRRWHRIPARLGTSACWCTPAGWCTRGARCSALPVPPGASRRMPGRRDGEHINHQAHDRTADAALRGVSQGIAAVRSACQDAVLALLQALLCSTAREVARQWLIKQIVHGWTCAA